MGEDTHSGEEAVFKNTGGRPFGGQWGTAGSALTTPPYTHTHTHTHKLMSAQTGRPERGKNREFGSGAPAKAVMQI